MNKRKYITYVIVCVCVRRFGSAQRPLQPYDAHLTHDGSSGDSSSGFTSQESTMERSKTGIHIHITHITQSCYTH